MDVPRAPRKKTGRNVIIAVAVVVLVLITVALGRQDPAAQTVSRSAILIDSVRRGDIVREVRGPGTLVPEQIRFITSQASARVERKLAETGQMVSAGELLLELSNPDLQIQTMQAEQQVRQAQIDLLNLKTNLRSQLLTQQGVVASTTTQHVSALQEAAAAESLVKRDLVSRFEVSNRKALAEEYTARLRIEKERLDLMTQAIDVQVNVQSSQVEQLEAIAARQRARLASLEVRAPEAGVLQDLTLQLGQWVPEGTTLAKVVQPGRLKAVLRIPESQARNMALGQPAVVDTRNGVINGVVARKDPSALGGSVTVDIRLEGELPAGAVPDLSVDGTIEIEKLTNVLYSGRPAFGSGGGPVGIFRVEPGGKYASRVQVEFGRSSVNTMEIVRGLEVGDKLILSDMSQHAGVDRVRIK